jgi:hypothetical protein
MSRPRPWPCWSSNAYSLPKGEWEFEIIVVLNGDPIGIQRLPDKFVEFVDVTVNELVTLHLREAGRGFCRWPVDVLFDECGKMYLQTGW